MPKMPTYPLADASGSPRKRPRQPSIPQPSGEPTEFDKHPRRFPIRPKASKSCSGGRLILIYDTAKSQVCCGNRWCYRKQCRQLTHVMRRISKVRNFGKPNCCGDENHGGHSRQTNRPKRLRCAPVIARAQELGADNQAIARALKAIAEELDTARPGPPDAAS